MLKKSVIARQHSKRSRSNLKRDCFVAPSGLLAMTCLFFFLINPCSAFAGSVYQDTNRFTYGFKRVLAAPFQIPIRMVQGTLYGPPVVGTVGGVLQGTFQTVGDLVGGVFDMGAAAAPYAKYAALAV